MNARAIEPARQEASSSPCTLCGSADAVTVLERKSEGRAIAIRKCTACGNTYLGDWQAFVAQPLYDYYADREWIARDHRDPINEARYGELLGRLARAPGRRLLDVGCGSGHFVEVAIRHGWEASGIELDAAAALCRARGLPVSNLSLYASELRRKSFDVVTLFEVAEHVAEPGRFLARAVELLKPGGLLYATVPNGDSLDARVQKSAWNEYHHEHVTYFSRRSLTAAIAAAGAQVVWLRAENICPSTIAAIRGRKQAEPAGPGGSPEQLRQSFERPAMKAVKRVANALLTVTGLGSTLKVLARKPG